MTESNKDLVSGKESATAEAKRHFAAIDFGKMPKGVFVRKMLGGVSGNAEKVHDMIKHLEAVWRGKAAPTKSELKRAKALATAQQEPATKAEGSLQKIGSYQPIYEKTKKLQTKINSHKS